MAENGFEGYTDLQLVTFLIVGVIGSLVVLRFGVPAAKELRRREGGLTLDNPLLSWIGPSESGHI